MTSQQLSAKEDELLASVITLSHDIAPDLPPSGDILCHIPKSGGVNDHYEMRLDGAWFVRWPGFPWERATASNSWFGGNPV